MKYLKLFESNWIKHTDKIAIDNPLREFSRKFEDFTLTLSIPDIKIRRYFKDNGSIDIEFSHKNYKFLIIRMYLTHDIIILEIIHTSPKWAPTHEDITIFYNFLIEQLKKFTHRTYGQIHTATSFECEIPFSEKDNVLNDLINNYEIYLNYITYNL